MFLLAPSHPGCPGQNPESHKTVVCVCVCMRACVRACVSLNRNAIKRPLSLDKR